MKIQKIHIMGLVVASLAMLVDLIFLLHEKIFYFMFGIAVIIAVLPFFLSFSLQRGKEKEKARK